MGPLPINRSKQLDEQILKFIVKDYHPFAIVEKDEIKNIVKSILPKYILPTRKTISSNLLLKIFYVTEDKVLLQLHTAADPICLSKNGWISMSNTNFRALAAHYNDQYFMLKSVLLGTLNL